MSPPEENGPFCSCVLSFWPTTGGDLALIQTSLLFLFKFKLVNIGATCFTLQKL